MKVTTFFSIGVLISFFIPWIEIGPLSFNGFQIPQSLDKIVRISHLFQDRDYDFFITSYFIYLIPITAVFSIIKDLTTDRAVYFLNEFSFGVIGVTLVLVLIRKIGLDTSIFSTGYYLMLILSVFGCISYFFQKQPQTQQPTESNYVQIVNVNARSNDTEFIPVDKTALFNQLSQLHSLKEKSVITEDIYEQERQAIMNKIRDVPVSDIVTVKSSETVSNIDEVQYDPYYAELFDDRNWFDRNKIAIVIIVFTVVLIIIINRLNT